MTTKRHHLDTPRSPRVVPVGFCLLLIVGSALGACGRRGFSNENDKLRAERLDLQREIDTLQEKLALREGELRAIREQAGAQPIAGVDPPRLAGIVLGMYSGPIDLDGDQRYDELRVYLRPVDQHSRQITAEGVARVRLIVTPAEGEPVTILDKRYEPDVFHAAYRSGVTGTHYTLEAGLPADRPPAAKLHVTLTDAETGRSYAAEKAIRLIRAAPSD